MKLRELRNIKFDASTARMAKAMNASPNNVRQWMSEDREVAQLANGDFVMLTAQTKIVRMPGDDLEEHF